MAFQYKPTATGLAFHNSNKFVKMCLGPFASGKSCMMAMEIFLNAAAQAPAPDGVRYSRIGVVRSSYPELSSATRRSLLEVLPPECGTIVSTGSPMKGLYNIPLPDGTRIQLELELWAIQSVEDCSKLRSCNWTSCFINEATGCCAEVFTTVTSRIGRFPPASMGGVTWGGIIMDMNYPQQGTWLHDFIHHPQDDWEVFWQPPAAFKSLDDSGNTVYTINPDAENLENLGAKHEDDPVDFTPQQRGMRFYKDQIDALARTGRQDLIENLYCLLDVPIVDGKPVFPNFSRTRHVAKQEVKPKPLQNIIIGIDTSGLHPAAVIIQEQNNQWVILDELFADNEGFEVFLHGMLVPLLRTKYPSCPCIAAIDPSNARDSWQGITPRERLAEVGIVATTEISNSPKVRIQCVEHMLNLHAGGLLVSPICELTIRGFESEYKYRRLRAAGSMGAVYSPQPEKGPASHLMDAGQYACLLIQKGIETYNADYAKVSEAVRNHRQKLARIV